ncbi:hypothetical protein DCD76_18880, partial [Acinetobacter baumannii]|uniref:hypothetical protein n=1 Tax=Acinetobacter baumannii TaxID=470 RepID=UPI000DE75EDA
QGLSGNIGLSNLSGVVTISDSGVVTLSESAFAGYSTITLVDTDANDGIDYKLSLGTLTSISAITETFRKLGGGSFSYRAGGSYAGYSVAADGSTITKTA